MQMLNDIWMSISAALAKGALLAVVPLAKASGIDFDDVLLSRPALDESLSRHGLKEKFSTGKVKCSCCSQTLNYGNLGGAKETESSIHLTCSNPGCSIRA